MHFTELKFILSHIVRHRYSLSFDYKLLAKLLIDTNLFSKEPADKANLINKLEIAISLLTSRSDDGLFKKYVEHDGAFLKKELLKTEVYIDFPDIQQKAKDCLAALNKEFDLNIAELPQVFVVDNFPSPYDNITTWDFMYANKDDETKYGIPEGLYMHKDRQFPIFGEYLIIHELVHFYVDKVKGDIPIKYRWIEEVFANWFPMKIFYEIYNDKEAVNFIRAVNDMYKDILPFSTISEYNYYDNLFRKVFYIGGHEGVKAFAKDYFADPTSEKWQQIFEDLLYNKIKYIKQYSRPHSIENELDIFLAAPDVKFNMFNLSVLDFAILNSIGMESRNFSAISEELCCEEKEVKLGIEKLQQRSFLISQDEHYSIIQDLKHLFPMSIFKITNL